jgi:hypothetical protein
MPASPTDTPTSPDTRADWRDLVGRLLLSLCAVSTLAAFAGGLAETADAPDDWVITQFWRTAGYLVFTGLWAMLAWSPRGYRGVWELVLLHKGLVAGFALTSDAPDASLTVAVDGGLVVATLVAWWLCRGWLSWRRTAPAAR